MVHLARGAFAADAGMVDVRILRCGVIAPDSHAVNVVNMTVGFRRELCHRAIVVEPRHRCEIARIQMSGALLLAISALVFAGLPTTSTLMSRLA